MDTIYNILQPDFASFVYGWVSTIWAVYVDLVEEVQFDLSCIAEWDDIKGKTVFVSSFSEEGTYWEQVFGLSLKPP